MLQPGAIFELKIKPKCSLRRGLRAGPHWWSLQRSTRHRSWFSAAVLQQAV